MVDKEIINKLCKRVDETTGYEQNISAYWENYLAANLDLVEVVRCGQCKHFHEYPYKGTNDLSGWGKCKKIDMDIDLTINDFCSCGERKCDNA